MKNRFRKLISCLSLLSVLVCFLAVPSFAASGVYQGFTYGVDSTLNNSLFTLDGVNVFELGKPVYAYKLLQRVNFFVFITEPSTITLESNNKLVFTFDEPYVLYSSSTSTSTGDFALVPVSNDDGLTSYTFTMHLSVFNPPAALSSSGYDFSPLTPVYDFYDPVYDASSLVTNAGKWVSSMAGLVMNNPLILAYSLLPILGVGIGLLVRAKNTNK